MNKIIIFLIVIFYFPVLAGDYLGTSIPCPEGGIKIRSHICCKDGYASHLRHDTETNKLMFGEYTDVYGECGCPNGGVKSKKNQAACCKGGFRYVDYKKDYVAIDSKACDYPEGGYKPKGDREAWCKDGFLYINKDDPWLKPDECGCPEKHDYKVGDEYSDGYCCLNGYELYTKDSYRINYEVCGCPKGTKHAKYDICCLNDKQGYAIENPSMGGSAVEVLNFQFCGCPENGQMKNVGLPLYICCKNGYKLDEKTGLYSIKEEACKSIMKKNLFKKGIINIFFKGSFIDH